MFTRSSILALIMVLVIVSFSSFAVTVKARTSVNSVPWNLTLYAGKTASGQYGFGNSAGTITSPGPTLNLLELIKYNITVYNVGTMDHSWEIVSSKAASTSPLWGAGIDISTYISPGNSGSVVFTPTQQGNFYYVCTFPGHIAHGMYGKVEVDGITPEYPTALMLMFMAIAVTAMAAFMAKQKTKIRQFF